MQLKVTHSHNRIERQRRLLQGTGIKKELHDSLRKLHKEATQKYALVLMANVGQDTGMTLYSIQPLAQRVGVSVASLYMGRPQRKGAMVPTGIDSWVYDRARFRNRYFGFDIGSSPESFRYIVGTPSKPVFELSFRPRVYQFVYHDVKWQAVRKAQAAYEAHMRQYPFTFGRMWKKVLYE